MFVGLVRRHATVLITGGTGVGKTTLLKALLAQCDVNERIVTVEEVRELGELGRGDHVSLVTREANVEGALFFLQLWNGKIITLYTVYIK